MKKIISLFQRNYDGDRLVRDEVVPGAEWVMAGEGVATRKWDGTACMVKDGKIYRRYDVKKKRKPPADFEPCQEPDPVTGHWPGWVPCKEGDPNNKWFFEAFRGDEPNGTYELCGPKINGNPEGFEIHRLIPHGVEKATYCPLTFVLIRLYFETNNIEGIVWHHPDGRMAKIKAKDFGIRRKGC